MYNFRLTYRLLIFSFFLLFISISIIAQEKNKKTDYPDMIMLSADYSSNTNSFSSISIYKQPSYSAMISYMLKNGLEFTLSPSFLGNKDSVQTTYSGELDLILGYQWDINEKASIYGGYTHMFYTDKTDEIRTAVTNNMELNFDYYGKRYATGISINYLFGKKGTLYLTYRNGLNFDFDNVFIKESILSVSPEIDLDFTNKNFYNEFIYDRFVILDFLEWMDNSYPQLSDWAVRSIILRGLDETKTIVKNAIDNNNPAMFGENYTFTSVNLLLPVMFTIKNFSLNLSAFAVIPLYDSDFYTPETQFFYNAGITYIFSL